MTGRRKEDRRAYIVSHGFWSAWGLSPPVCGHWGVLARRGAPPRCHASGATVDVHRAPPAWCDGLRARWQVELWTFRAPSRGRHVRRAFLRNAWLAFTPMLPATACHQRHYLETDSRSKHSSHKL